MRGTACSNEELKRAIKEKKKMGWDWKMSKEKGREN